MIRFAHLSDVHLDRVPEPKFTELLSKRLIGYANWRYNRAHHMSGGRLGALVADMKAASPDHIAVTGDLTNIALPGEFENAANWLRSLGSGDDVTVIPGNHDAYVPFAGRHYRRLWAPWMSDERTPGSGRVAFPFLRTFRDFALIGTSTAVATAPFMATGRLGSSQLNSLRKILQYTGEGGFFRIVLIHHPPKMAAYSDFFRRMTDGKRFCDMIRQTGAELILHGHDHIASTITIPGPGMSVPVVGAASASGPAMDGPAAGGYALHEIDRSKNGYLLSVIHRGFDAGGTIVDKDRLQFAFSGRRTTHR